MRFLMSANQESICCFNSVAGCSMSIVNGWRLNGSNWSLQHKTHTRWSLYLLLRPKYYYNYNCFTAPWTLSGTTWVNWYEKGKTKKVKPIYIYRARDSEWQWHHLSHIQICTSPQTDNHASIPPLGFLQAECPSCQPINSVKDQNTKSLV